LTHDYALLHGNIVELLCYETQLKSIKI